MGYGRLLRELQLPSADFVVFVVEDGPHEDAEHKRDSEKDHDDKVQPS